MLPWEGLLTSGGGLIGVGCRGRPFRAIRQWCPMPSLKVWVCRAWWKTSNKQYWHQKDFSSCGQRLGLINLTVSLLTAEIIGLCQRSGSFSNWGQVPWDLEMPSNAGKSPLSHLPVLWERPFLSAWAIQPLGLNPAFCFCSGPTSGLHPTSHVERVLENVRIGSMR